MGIWKKFLASLYDPMLSKAEQEWLSALRARMASEARGATLEIGGGTGANLPHYDLRVGQLILSDPELSMLHHAKTKKRPAGTWFLMAAQAESLPFRDNSFDTVVSTMALCTVARPGIAVTEIRRVLRPDGRFLFIEHMRNEGPVCGWQRRLTPFWRRLALGCHLDRPTLQTIFSAGFRVVQLERQEPKGVPRILRPIFLGRAAKSDQ